MAKIVKTLLAQIPSAARKSHSENCPSSCCLSKQLFGSVTTSLCLGRFWKTMEVTTFADKFWYMLTRTGAICLKLCRAKSLKVCPLHPSTYFLRGKNSTVWCQQRNWEHLTKTPSISLCFLHPDINGKTEWSDHSIPGKSLWSFCDSSVTLFKVKWPPTRRFKGHLASPGISQSYLCLLPGLTSCRVCSSESEPRKPKSGRPCILGNNSSLWHFSVPALATSAAGWRVILDGLSQSFTKN